MTVPVAPVLETGLSDFPKLAEVQPWLESLRDGQQYHEVQFTLAGYVFVIQRPRSHEPAPSVWKVFCRNPSTATDLMRIPERLGYFWDWRLAVEVILTELSLRLS